MRPKDEYSQTRDFIRQAGITVLPSLLAEVTMACVRRGCFKDDESMISVIRIQIRDERATTPQTKETNE